MDIKERLKLDLERYKRDLADPALERMPSHTYFTLYGSSEMGFHNYEDRIYLPSDTSLMRLIVNLVKWYYESEIEEIEQQIKEL